MPSFIPREHDEKNKNATQKDICRARYNKLYQNRNRLYIAGFFVTILISVGSIVYGFYTLCHKCSIIAFVVGFLALFIYTSLAIKYDIEIHNHKRNEQNKNYSPRQFTKEERKKIEEAYTIKKEQNQRELAMDDYSKIKPEDLSGLSH